MTTLDGDGIRFSLSGEIDLANAAEIEDDVLGSISNVLKLAVVDLTDVEFIDSAGMRILFTLAGRLQTLQIDLEVVAPLGSPARRVIELSGLEPLVVLSPAVAPVQAE